MPFPDFSINLVNILAEYKVSGTVRVRRGIDIDAGCGQLKSKVIDPGDIPITKGVMSNLAVNPSAAERMGVTIPQSIMDKATEVVEE